MDIGKLPPELLGQLIKKAPLDARVIVGPKIGEDAAVIDFGDRLLVAKTDPITFATDRIGWYAVHVNANDLAVSNADPKWFLATVLLPERAEESLAQDIFEQIIEACSSIGVSLVGGHTEITYGLDRPVVVGCLMGETTRDRLVTSSGSKPGDAVLVTQGISIEGTSLLAREAENDLISAGVSPEVVESAKRLLVSPGISVLKAARAVNGVIKVSAMHDPTEGGLATGLRELADASGAGVEIDRNRIPVLPECETICEALGLDPIGLIASGCLLLTCKHDDVTTALSALQDAGIPGFVIGKILPREEGLIMLKDDQQVELPQFPRDEIARFFTDRA